MRAVNHRVFAVVSLCLGLCTCALAQSVPEAPALMWKTPATGRADT